jgi:hypothetical protein
MILVHASPKTLAPYRTKNLGVLSSPRRFYKATEGIEEWRWAADNDAFSEWNEERYKRMLNAIWGLRGCLFVTAPDVVGDAARTLELFEEWYDELVAVLQPLALVAQDGLTPEQVPWQRIDALFIGGTTEWKMGEEARVLMREARMRSKWLHMGRVNSYERGRYARWLGCDSIDGTQFSWFRDTKLPAYLNSLEQLILDNGAERPLASERT